MAMSVNGLAGAVLLGLCSLAVLADEELPEAEFLEYLGMWEGSDEDWVMFNQKINADNMERSEAAPDGEDSTEKPDEN